MSATLRVVRESDINKRTTEIFGQSLTAYQKAFDGLKRLKKEMVSTHEEIAAGPSSEEDSLVALTQVWLEKTQEKISETLYQMAEVNTLSIDRLMTAPIPVDLSQMARLEYRSQVLIKAVKPLLDVVIEAHRRNLEVADSLSLLNRWTEESRAKILSSLNLLGKEYGILSFDALEVYRGLSNRCRKIAFVDDETFPMDSVNMMVNLIELSKSYSQVALAFARDGVKKAESYGIESSHIVDFQEAMVQYVLQLADTLEKNIFIAQNDQQRAESLFDTFGDFRYEEMLALFEDNVYFLSDQLRTVLETAYTIEQKFTASSPSGPWIGVQLVRLDPDTYSDRLKIPLLQMRVTPDTTWYYTMEYHDDWETPSFPAKGWYRPIGVGDARIAWLTSSSFRSSGSNPNINHGVVYIRKEFDIPGYPVKGTIRFSDNKPNRVFVNNMLIPEDVNENPMSIKSYIQTRNNLLALECTLTNDFSVNGTLEVKYIPQNYMPYYKR